MYKNWYCGITQLSWKLKTQTGKGTVRHEKMKKDEEKQCYNYDKIYQTILNQIAYVVPIHSHSNFGLCNTMSSFSSGTG